MNKQIKGIKRLNKQLKKFIKLIDKHQMKLIDSVSTNKMTKISLKLNGYW